MKKSSVSPEEWIRHRKLRKKIASAKWYAQKKQREIDEQNTHREQLEREHAHRQAESGHLIWPDPVRRAEWYGVVAHHSHGYPVRPPEVDPLRWRTWVERIEADVEELCTRATQANPAWGTWLGYTWIRKIFRQLGIRECRGLWGDVPSVPWGCACPCARGRLWTTSTWNWLWVMTHLGNHREQFPVLWCHLHEHALRTPTPPGGWDDWQFILSDSDCCRWIDRMTEQLQEHVREPDDSSDGESSDEPSSQETNESQYVTQLPTPEWNWSLTDTDTSDSLPSSLDNFVTETFTAPPCPPSPSKT